MDSKISVILPIYNVERYLDTCIQSVVNQTYRNLEIILVDDGSPDSCPQICEEWEKKDERIIAIHKQNEGLGYARNSGLEVATGEYVLFVDSDDYIDTEMVATLYKTLIATNADTTYCGLKRVYPDGKIVPVPSIYDETTFGKEDILEKVLMRMFGNIPEKDDGSVFYMSVWHAIYSMDIIKRNEIFFPTEREFMSEDLSFHIDYLRHAQRVTCIPEQLYFYRINPESLSSRYDQTRFERLKQMHVQVLNKLDSFMNKEEYLQYEYGWFLSISRGQIMKVVERAEKKAIQRIRRIVEDELVQEAIKRYGYYKNPIKRRIFNYLIDKKKTILLFGVVCLYTWFDK